MSHEQIEVARLAYDVAFVQRSVAGVRELVAEDFTWRQRAEWPGRSDYTIEEIPQLWADLDDTYTEYNLLPVEFVDVGEYVVVTVETTARLRASDRRIARRLWHVWHIRNGLVLEGRTYGSRAEAMEAVGPA
jgi:ketosteroid isomerase-like protein